MPDAEIVETSGIASESLVDLLDRVLDPGAVVAGDLMISVAGVDLLYLNLRLLIGSVESLQTLANSPDGTP